jgi:3-oxoacyl-[acyl-carrier protein] reductase
VSLSEQVDQNFEKILNEFNNVTVLVNNAGITRDQLLLRLKPDDWDAVLTTNLKSAFNTTKFIAKAWLRSKTPGSIINITSVIGQTGNAGQSNYAASKAGLIGFTKSVALELASRQIRANCVAPGFIRSDMTEALNDGQKTAIIDRVPLGSMGTPQDVASACVFLGSEAARYITGQTINVDGGLVMI